MNKHEGRCCHDGPDSVTWGDSMRGGWLNVLSPSVALLVTALGEKFGLPGWLSALTVLVIWFAGFFVLIRVQFARRHRNADVFKAFWRTTVLGFVVVAGLLVAMYFIR
jgi:hypothetical protein